MEKPEPCGHTYDEHARQARAYAAPMLEAAERELDAAEPVLRALGRKFLRETIEVLRAECPIALIEANLSRALARIEVQP